MFEDLTARQKRYIGTTLGGAIGGASLGGVISMTGAAGGKDMSTGKAMGWGALFGAGAGLVTAIANDAVEGRFASE